MKLGTICAMSLILGGKAFSQNVEFLPEKGASTSLPFSAAVRVDDLYFLSGQVGIFPGTTRLAKGVIAAETKQTLDNLDRILKANKLIKNDVIKCTVMLADIEEWNEFNQHYMAYFSPPYPARSAFASSGLAFGARVELDCIAAKS